MRKQESNPLSINVGGSSVLMIFAVLCLTVFAVLSFTTAMSERSTANKYADSTEAYYAAEYQAEQQIEQIASSGQSGEITFKIELEGTGNRVLAMTVYADGAGHVDVKDRSIINESEWTPEDDMNVWDGGDLAANPWQ